MAATPDGLAHRPPPATVGNAAALAPLLDSENLSTRLGEIEAAAAGPVDALEPALRTILDATGAAAGAICLYDRRHELLRLAAEIGLSDAGCHRLRTVRRGDPDGWDMPLHGLLNRRAYLIEKASKNRYVPALVEDGAKVGTVACLPLFAGSTALGSIVLLTLKPRMLAERDIHGLDKPLRALGRMIEALRRREAAAVGSLAPAAAQSAAPTDGAERAKKPARELRAAPDRARSDADRIASLETALERARREQARLAAALEGAEAERAQLAQALREDARAVDHGEIDRLRARLAEAEAGAAHEQRAREELEAALSRGASTGQEDLRTAVEAARRAEASRASAVAESMRLAAELERLRAGMSPEEAHLPDRMEIDRLRARLAEAEAGAAYEQRVREELEAALQRGTTAGQQELRRALEAARGAEAARAALAADNARLVAEVDALRGTVPHADAQAADRMEIDRLRARLAEAEAGAAHEQRAREELEAAHSRGASAGQHDLHAALEAARRAEAARATVSTENVRLAAEVERLRYEAAGLESTATALAAAEQEQARLAAALQAAEAARADETRARAAVEQRTAAEVERLTARLAKAEAMGAGGRGAATAGDATTEKGPDLQTALEALRTAEQARAASAAELATTKSELASAAASVEALKAETGRAHQEIERLGVETRAARTENERLARGLVKAHEREVETLRAEHAASMASTAELTTECDRLREALAALEDERDRLAADVQGGAAARAHLEQALAHGLEEARAREQDLGARLEAREREAETLRAEHLSAATVAAARLAALVAEDDGLRSTVASLTAERDRLAADLEGTAAARARLEEALARGLEDARAREQDVGARLEAREREAESLRAEHAAATTQIESLGAECDRLRGAAGALEAERNRLGAEVEGASAARSRLEEALAGAAEEARAREQDLAARLEAREREVEAVRTERAADAAASAAQLETLGTECARLRDVLAGLETERDRAAQPPAAALAPEEPAPADEAASAQGAPAGGRVVVLDGDPLWERASANGQPITVLEPAKDLAARLAEIAPARIVVNLASRGALDALASLRAAKFSGRFWACLAAGGRALGLGMVEPAHRPVEPDAIVGALGAWTKRGARIVTVGEDVDALVSLRQALAREGMSVSMAWNAKQAAELLPMVRPTAVVLDLELPAREAAGIVADLCRLNPLPNLVLIPGGKDLADDLAAVLAEPAHRQWTVPVAQFLQQVVRRSESPAAETS